MIKVAITGGIGSGKSYVAKIFELHNIPVYYADKEAKRLMISDKALKSAIKALLGHESYHKNGRPDRAFIASKIFADPKLLKGINAIVHPAVKRDFERWAYKQDAPYVLEESALIFEINSQSYFNFTILVVADQEVRIQRVMKRDGATREQVIARIKKQWPDKKKIKLADFVIENNQTKSLIKQVNKIHNQIIKN